MRLKKACVCIDCEEVFNIDIIKHCPTCGSESFMPLSQYIKPLGNRRVLRTFMSSKTITWPAESVIEIAR
jgi:predicted  nucleic acid-binding Zn-ribbon protein